MKTLQVVARQASNVNQPTTSHQYEFPLVDTLQPVDTSTVPIQTFDLVEDCMMHCLVPTAGEASLSSVHPQHAYAFHFAVDEYLGLCPQCIACTYGTANTRAGTFLADMCNCLPCPLLSLYVMCARRHLAVVTCSDKCSEAAVQFADAMTYIMLACCYRLANVLEVKSLPAKSQPHLHCLRLAAATNDSSVD